MVSRAMRLCGTDLVDPPMRILKAGLLTVELDNGALRYVRFGEVEVLRAIAFLVTLQLRVDLFREARTMGLPRNAPKLGNAISGAAGKQRCAAEAALRRC